MRVSRKESYAALGTLLSLGAPLGWLAARALLGASSERLTVGYLGVGTALAFAGFGFYLGSVADELERANRRLTDLASTDALTGLRNARLFHELLDVECARSRRDGQPLSVIMLDLDRFKLVNDEHGHAAGDVVLAHLGAVLRRAVREADIPCRVGGEEFAVISARTPLKTAAEMAERIRVALEADPIPGPMALRITASLGVSSGTGASPKALFTAADAALYRSKQAGRNRVSTEPSDAGGRAAPFPSDAPGSRG